MLFDKSRHISLSSQLWSKDYVLEVVNDIIEKAINAYSEDLWPKHKDEDSETEINKSFYFGAAGTLWALLFLTQKNKIQLPFVPGEVIKKISRMYVEGPDAEDVVPSYFLGQLGIELLNYKLNPCQELEDKIFNLIKSNISNPCVDQLWGAPGSMLPAFFMLQITGKEQWKQLFLENVSHLIEQWKYDADSQAWYWEYRQKDRMVKFIGAGHGFFGNLFSLLKGQHLLLATQNELIVNRAVAVTKHYMKEENSMANWPATFDGKGQDMFLVQWCHGAPGMIQSLAEISAGQNSELDEMMMKAAELVWQAGPLQKGIGLCHGTDGNGMSLLKIHQRTQDPLWLNRARQFAMSAIEQRNGRFTLWTGELGLAIYLQCCLDGQSLFPGFDQF